MRQCKWHRKLSCFFYDRHMLHRKMKRVYRSVREVEGFLSKCGKCR